MKKHLAKFHAQEAAHNVTLAKLYKSRAAACDGDESEHYSKLATAHTEHAENHLNLCKALESAPDTMPHVGRESRTNDSGEGLHAAMGLDNLEKLVPSSVHLVLPDAPRLAPRFGQPDPNGAEDATAAIDAVCR